MGLTVADLLAAAARLNVPGLVAKGVNFIAEVQANAKRAGRVLTDGQQAELDAIHAEALAAADALDQRLAEAAKR